MLVRVPKRWVTSEHRAPINKGMGSEATKRILLTGATGFVGRAVAPGLLAAGWQVRGLTRNGERARRLLPGVSWIVGDVGNTADCARALTGCDVAMYLVHGMGEGADFELRETEQAAGFGAEAARAKVGRIVYLGGVAPVGAGSAHLRSRQAVGRALLQGTVPTLELRASMIIGHGSLSWLIVRDLAARLPVMVLPTWLRSRTEPVAIDDVVVALLAAARWSSKESGSFDLPGPDLLSGRQIIEETAREMRLPPPFAIEVPVLTPRLSSHWVRFVTRAKWSVAREVVVGLTHDLLARDAGFWPRIGHFDRLSFREAARRALADERRDGPIPGLWGVVERALKRESPSGV